MFQSPGDIAFQIFNFPVYYYGIIMAVSIAVGCYTAYYLYKKFYDFSEAEKIFDIAPFVIILGILGARLYYCIVNFSYYAGHPVEILNIRQGGLSIHGMILTGIVSLYFLAKLYKISFLKLADCFFCATALAQNMGRWGNFFNSEAFGTPTDVFWKLYIPPSARPTEYINYEYFHPAFLYESILDLLIFIVLVLIFKKYSNHAGSIACIYLILYSFVRIFVEYFRIDSVLNIGGFPIAQVMSFVLIFAASLGLFILNYKKS